MNIPAAITTVPHVFERGRWGVFFDAVILSKLPLLPSSRVCDTMVKVLGITAFGSGVSPHHWWEWVLVAVISASGVIGLITFLWGSYNAIRKLFRVRFLGIL